MKKWWQSKTIWVNVLSVAGEMVNLLAGKFIPVGTVAIASNAINIALRFVTSQPIAGTEKPSEPTK